MDEHRHPPTASALWCEWWDLDFAASTGGLGGYVRLTLWPNLGRSWFWASLVGTGRPLVSVVVDDAPLPRPPGLALRAEGLWADLTCETPLEHWSVGLEAFGVALEDPDEVFGRGHGERTALGFDLEWEDDGEAQASGDASYEVPCRTHGEVLVGRETLAVEGPGLRRHHWGLPDWWDAPCPRTPLEGLAAPVPLVEPADPRRVARLRRALGPNGWLEAVERPAT